MILCSALENGPLKHYFMNLKTTYGKLKLDHVKNSLPFNFVNLMFPQGIEFRLSCIIKQNIPGQSHPLRYGVC